MRRRVASSRLTVVGVMRWSRRQKTYPFNESLRHHSACSLNSLLISSLFDTLRSRKLSASMRRPWRALFIHGLQTAGAKQRRVSIQSITKSSGVVKTQKLIGPELSGPIRLGWEQTRPYATVEPSSARNTKPSDIWLTAPVVSHSIRWLAWTLRRRTTEMLR